MTADESRSSFASSEPRVYVPGYARWKLLLCVGGVIVFCIGSSQLWPPMRLVLFGGHAQAVATRIIQTKPNAPDTIVRDDQPQVQPAAHYDHSVFWNEFTFQANDGRSVSVRENVGSRLRPLYPLIDADGLPTTTLVCYDVRHPGTAVFPTEISTWLVPAGLMLVGVTCAVVSAVLLYWARRPIELPDVTPASTRPLP